MKLSAYKIEIPPPGERTSRGIGWSKVFVHMKDDEVGVMPNVTIATHVPYQDNQTFGETRESALSRARLILREALELLDRTTVEEIDRAAASSGSHV
jgi:hypothetical protein